MDIIPALVKEFDIEAVTTCKMFALLPEDKWDWKPHSKSMSLQQLSVHLAEIPQWISMSLLQDELDLGGGYHPTPVENKTALLTLLEKSLAQGRSDLAAANEEKMKEKWTLRSGNHIIAVMNRYEIVRHCFSQTTHHRAQLGVYLRLLDIPIPASYGPSADDMG